MSWLVYVNIAIWVASAAMIVFAFKLNMASRKLHQVRTAMTMLELNERGTTMWWRDRALKAEAELRAMKAAGGGGSSRIRLP